MSSLPASLRPSRFWFVHRIARPLFRAKLKVVPVKVWFFAVAAGALTFLLISLYGEAEVERLKVNVLSVRPHDPEAFTQGFLIDLEGVGDARLFESTGLYSQSSLRENNLDSGANVRIHYLPPAHFAEGLALVGDRLIQLTWREGVAHVYDRDTFEVEGQFAYTGEGWGLCYDGERLIMSDGSNRLYFRSPDTFELLDPPSVAVTLDDKPVQDLNELEYVGGFVYANVWGTDEIVKIDPASGKVRAVIDASGLLTPSEQAEADVLNGIAYHPEQETFFITGKYWPKTFEVTFVPVDS